MQKLDTKKPMKCLYAIGYVVGVFFIILGSMLSAPKVLAGASEVLPSFSVNTQKVSKNSILEANINLKTDEATKVSGTSVYIKYPANILEYKDAEPNDQCKRNNFKLNQLLEAKANTKIGVLKLSRVEIASDSQLPSGEFCLTTVTFKAKPNFWFWFPWYRRSGTISFSEIHKWQIVGPSGISSIDNAASQAKIQVIETN